MSEPTPPTIFLPLIRNTIRAQLDVPIVSFQGTPEAQLVDELADRIARNVVQLLAPTLEAYAEACALLDQTLGIIDGREFQPPEAQAKIEAARAFLGGHP